MYPFLVKRFNQLIIDFDQQYVSVSARKYTVRHACPELKRLKLACTSVESCQSLNWLIHNLPYSGKIGCSCRNIFSVEESDFIFKYMNNVVFLLYVIFNCYCYFFVLTVHAFCCFFSRILINIKNRLLVAEYGSSGGCMSNW